MEEEIIIPEEEVFNYGSLRYILDKNGYVCHASLGGLIICDLGECTEYKGEVPNDYSSIEEWYDKEIERLNAWKIVEGNLVYDEQRYNEFKKNCEEQAEKNAPATREYVDTRINGIKIENKDLKALFDKSYYEGFEIATLNDASDFEIDKLVIHTTTKEKQINLALSTSNMLYHELIATEKEGVSFTVNEDKSINVKGTSKKPFEIDILGDSENTNPFFVFKKGYNYYLNPIADGNNGIEWNGDTTDKEVMVFEELGMTLYKVSDKILNKEDLIGKTYTFSYSDGTNEEIEILETDYDNVTNGRQIISYGGYIPTIVIVSETTKEVPYSIGTYFFKLDAGEDDYAYVSSLSSSANSCQMKMYFNDGIEKTEIYSGTGGSILFTDETKPVTNVTLSFNGTFNTTLFPMLNLGETAMEYEEGKYELITIDLPEYECIYPSDTLYPSEDEYPCFWGDIAIRIEGGKVFLTDESERELTSLLTPKTYSTKTTVYTFEDSTLDLNYITCYSNGVPYDEVIKSINNSPEKITINADKIDVKGVLSVLGESGSTVINGNNISTGSIQSSNYIPNSSGTKIDLSNGTIDTKNFKVNSNGGVSVNGSVYAGNGSTIGGLTMSSGILQSDRLKLDATNGIVSLFNSSGGSMILSNAVRLSATSGVGIYATSKGTLSAPSENLDLKACNGKTAYLASMVDDVGTDETSAVSCSNGMLSLRSDGTIYANGSAIGGSSSKNTKTNIEELTQEKKDELYGLFKDIPLYEYDYKPKYGKEINYGFLIEDIEDTKLNDLLHIVKINEDIKTYCSEDLTRLNLIMIKELMNKVEILENKIKEMESDK